MANKALRRHTALKLEAIMHPALCMNHSLLPNCSLVLASGHIDCSFVTCSEYFIITGHCKNQQYLI